MLPYVDFPFIYLSTIIGASPDELKLLSTFFLSYPLAGLLKRIPDRKPWQKNLFIIGVSLFYLVGLFDLWSGLRTLLISSVGAYALAYYVHGPLMPWLGFVFLMGHLSINQVHRKNVSNPSSVDITGAQMVLVMKLTAFCWNVQDGRLRELDVSNFQKEHALKELPPLLEYAAYVLFFPSLMAGPAFDYIEYRRWIETTMFDLPPGTDPVHAPRTRKQRRIPRSGTPATFKAVLGVIWLLIFLKLSVVYAPTYLLGSRYLSHNILRRAWIMHMTGFSVRTKYYAVWSLSEGACILSGIGYKGVDPKTGHVNWDRLQNVNPLGVELAQNSRAYLGNWNINTNNWLRNYMYLRVTPKGKKPGFRASMATFVTSAFWHGFYPGYYMAFILASLIQTVAKNCRRHIRPFFLAADGSGRPTKQKYYYDIVSYVTTQLAFSFTVTPFYLLTFDASASAWARVYFYCVVGVAASLGFFASPGKAWLKKQIEARMRAAGGTTVSSKPPAAVTETRRLGDELSRKIGIDVRPNINRHNSDDGAKGQSLGLPDDPGRDLDEIMQELRREVELRTSRGQSISAGLQEAVQQVGEVKRRIITSDES